MVSCVLILKFYSCADKYGVVVIVLIGGFHMVTWLN